MLFIIYQLTRYLSLWFCEYLNLIAIEKLCWQYTGIQLVDEGFIWLWTGGVAVGDG